MYFTTGNAIMQVNPSGGKESVEMTKPVRVAMIGVGAISGIYLQNLTETFREVELIGVCDLIP